MDLYRNVRNTLHNNGKFYSRTGTNTVVTWKGIRYEFVHTTVPSFISWDFNMILLQELIDLNRALMEAPPIQALGGVQ